MRRAFLLIAAAAVGFVASSPQLTGAAGVVGSGTPESCTEAAFLDAFDGGGDVTFDCGAAPHTIALAEFQEVAIDTSIDGGGLITLSGANASPFFRVGGGVVMQIDGLTLTRGLGSFGAIENLGTLIIQDSRIEECNAVGAEHGTITNYANLTILGVTFAENTSAYSGGAIFSYGGTVDIAESTFIENSTPGPELHNGGAISGFFFANILVEDSTFTGNFSTDGGAIAFDGVGTVTNVDFVGNQARETGGGASDYYGGALLLGPTADVEITDSHFEGNEAADDGGAIANDAGVLVVERSRFTQNEPTAAVPSTTAEKHESPKARSTATPPASTVRRSCTAVASAAASSVSRTAR
jgi:predicted outer membrane repeat protein